MAARGIGAFINGAFKGYQFASDVKDKKKDRERRDKLDKIAEEDRERSHKRQDQQDEWAKDNHDYTVSERNRLKRDRDELDAIYDHAGDMTDAAIEASTPIPVARGATPPSVAGGDGDDVLAGATGRDDLTAPPSVPRDASGRPIVPERDGAASAGGYVPTQEDLDLRYASEQRNAAVGIGSVPPVMAGPPVRRAPRGAMGPVDSMPPPRAAQPDRIRRQDIPDAPPSGVSNLQAAPMTQAPAPSAGYEATPNAPLGYRAQPNETPSRGPLGAAEVDGAVDRGNTTGLPMPVATADAAPQVSTTPAINGKGTQAERDQLSKDTQRVLADTALPGPASLSDAIDDAPKATRGTLEGERNRRADDVAKSWMDEYAKTGAPYVAEQLARKGMLAEAQQYQTWIETQDTKRGMESYGRAAYFASQGDMEGFGDAVFDLYNNEGYFGDGLTMNKEKSQFEKDDNGNTIGAEVVFQDASGNEFVQRWETMDEMIMDALTLLSPEKAFEMRIDQIGKAAEIRTDAAKREADFADFVRKEAVKNGYKNDDVERIAETAEALAEERGMMSSGDWGTLSDEEKMEAVLDRIAAEDAAAKRIKEPRGAANAPEAPPEPLRRPG